MVQLLGTAKSLVVFQTIKVLWGRVINSEALPCDCFFYFFVCLFFVFVLCVCVCVCVSCCELGR